MSVFLQETEREQTVIRHNDNVIPLRRDEVAAAMLRHPAGKGRVICDCGDPTCGCGCIPGNYPCEHGSMGEGCGA